MVSWERVAHRGNVPCMAHCAEPTPLTELMDMLIGRRNDPDNEVCTSSGVLGTCVTVTRSRYEQRMFSHQLPWPNATCFPS